MGQCYGKAGGGSSSRADHDDIGVVAPPSPLPANGAPQQPATPRRRKSGSTTPVHHTPGVAWPSPYPAGGTSPLPAGVSPSPARSTPRRFFKRPFPPPSPAKHIKATLAKRLGGGKPKEGTIPEEGGVGAAGAGGGADGAEAERPLDKTFGFAKNFGAKYELGKEVGRGHFGHTCSAVVKKGEYKGHTVAVKIISKAKMTTAISIEDVRREVKILKALSGHNNLVRFYDACEDALNVYIVMELCEGGELLDRILARGGRYTEEDAKAIVVQILSVVAFCHLQGVVHRDLKPEILGAMWSVLYNADERLNDIVGSAYYVAPEVLHRSYSMEADIWSIGVITYILLCGSRPFWARTESGIFRSVLRADPNFDDSPWPSVSAEAKDFVKRFLNKDYRKRMTAVQALTHPWLRDEQRQIPLDILIFRLLKQYLRATPLKRLALKALTRYLTDAMKESRVLEFLHALEPLAYRRMDFEEFCAAAISPYQLEALERWEEIAGTAFQHFEQEGNRVISVEELAQELNLAPTHYSIVQDWIRNLVQKIILAVENNRRRAAQQAVLLEDDSCIMLGNGQVV
ncbi:hypothetical protein PR202_ga14379 [Eleusine coracana subsp. coracana]|uniref:Protein kinase domain-containing protein n=1 Tax=Eleusine coracana subsp. coracana TaxID=191504 RepID=A0AAV5CGI3_ELECO|nr:hypothetical protein PR202_ga14379 [Eleusine coracana subsp. coracana]